MAVCLLLAVLDDAPCEALRAAHASMQGINRLGKAAPKPGSLRPPDPNRRQDLDLFSEGAETDADYMRMVHDVRLISYRHSVLCWSLTTYHNRLCFCLL